MVYKLLRKLNFECYCASTLRKVSNAAIVHRFATANLKGLLSDIHEYAHNLEKGYNALRHDVARCATFSGFARFLAREFKEKH